MLASAKTRATWIRVSPPSVGTVANSTYSSVNSSTPMANAVSALTTKLDRYASWARTRDPTKIA
jgi:hypothetical protein